MSHPASHPDFVNFEKNGNHEMSYLLEMKNIDIHINNRGNTSP